MPFGAETTLFGLLDEPIKLGVADVNVGVLVVFAITSMGVYGIVLAGWSSNSKYSLFGGLRASAQMISYELSYATALAAVILLAGSMSLREVVDAQAGYWFGFIPQWYVFLQPLGFIIYVIAGVAETNRAPFDFPEAEQELVAGYNTEYSSVRFALFPQAEYINMVDDVGRGHRPVPRRLARPVPAARVLGWIWFLVEGRRRSSSSTSGCAGRVPRYRYDQLMKFGWKCLFPASVHQPARDGGAGALFQCLRALVFYLLVGAGRSAASALVIGQRNPMYSVLLLIVSFGGAGRASTSMLDAPFVAVAQIIIYAGAIMVLFLFVVMLLNAPQEDAAEWDRTHPLRQPGRRALRRPARACCWSCSWPGRCCGSTSSTRRWAAAPTARRPSARSASSGRVLFTDYAFAFEATSVLILVAMVGAVVLARREGDA